MTAAAPKRLHPASLISRAIRVLPQTAGLGAAYGAMMDEVGLAGILAIAGGAVLVGTALSVLAWWRFHYTVGAEEIVIESGLLNRQRRVIPFDRVHDIALERSAIARLFGTAKVRIETGGSDADEGTLEMVALSQAEALRDTVRHRTPRPVAEAERPAEPIIFSMDLRRVLLSGLFNFSLLFLAAIFAVLQNLEEFGLIDPWDWIGEKGREAAQRSTATELQTFILLGAATLVIVVLLGMVTGVVRTLARDYRFRLSRVPSGFRRRRGLITLSEVVIPMRRIQAARIDSGLAGGALGWSGLSFQTLGSSPRQQGAETVAPFAREPEYQAILHEAALPVPPVPDSFRRAPARALLRQSLPWLVLGLIALVPAVQLEPRVGFLSAALFAIAVGTALGWSRHGYALGEQALFVRAGFFSRRLWIVPLTRLQQVRVTAGPMQQRLGLASLLVDTAGGLALRGPWVVDLPAADADRLGEELYRAYGAGRQLRSVRTAGQDRNPHVMLGKSDEATGWVA